MKQLIITKTMVCGKDGYILSYAGKKNEPISLATCDEKEVLDILHNL